MEKLLKEIENNLATLKCRLEEQGINVIKLEVDLWDDSIKIGFKVGVWNGTDWISRDGELACNHSAQDFIKVIERKKLLNRKLGGV